MRQAMDSVIVQNWESALELWRQAFNLTTNTKLRAEAANNIAIAYEILGDYDEALKYAKLALDIFNARMIVDNAALTRLTNYIIELSRRQDDVLLLNKQLGNF
jgi:tetratricopeptide (TPR) repeat protein